MYKILWFSNVRLSDIDCKFSGSWLYSMSDLLTRSEAFQITNICVSESSSDIDHIVISEKLDEYIISKRFFKKIKNNPRCENEWLFKLCISLTPNIIHVWGLENPFSNILPRLNLPIKLLLEIQGLRFACADVFYGDLSPEELFRCMGFREFILPWWFSLFAQKIELRKYGNQDMETLSLYKYISTQSEWVRMQLSGLSNTTIYNTFMSIRKEFFEGFSEYKTVNKEIAFFTSSSSLIPYKSLQTSIRALSIVAKKYPNVKLYVVGDIKPKRRILINGYYKYISRLIKDYGLEDNIVFPGALTASEMITLMKRCICTVQTSYVESYSLAVVESMAVGLPVICSYAGAMPELIISNETGYLYSPGDFRMCAGYMFKMIEDENKRKEMSINCINHVKHDNDPELVKKRQIEIYNMVLSE